MWAMLGPDCHRVRRQDETGAAVAFCGVVIARPWGALPDCTGKPCPRCITNTTTVSQRSRVSTADIATATVKRGQ